MFLVEGICLIKEFDLDEKFNSSYREPLSQPNFDSLILSGVI